MDITNESLKTMKAKQLRRIIRESILEVLAEGNTYAGKDAVDDAQKDSKWGSLSGIGKADAITKLKAGGTVTIGEAEIDEMARLAKGFRLADPEINSTTFTKTISGTPLSSIIDYFRANPGAEKTQLQSHFGFVRPQIANAVVNGLLDAGILVKLGAGGEVEATPEPGEEVPVQATEPEDLFMGSASNPLAMYFDNEPNDSGEEDFNAEEEPTAGELEPGEPVSTGGMSDEDYEAFMQYSDLADRLAATKSNLLKLKRKKGGTAGDISDRPSNEEARLRDLKDRLQKKVDDLVAGSKYLQKKIEKQTGKAYEPVEVEPEEEDTIDESYNAEYEKRKLQFYAGIIK
jgi:hypothetical protein